jgi:MAP/microtubule affinity-regulating kinase
MAPELTQKREYDGMAVDMWALGVLLYVMLTGIFPFRGNSESDLYHRIQRGNFTIPDFVSKDAKRVIYCLLEQNPKRRITSSELIKDPWVRCPDIQNLVSINRNKSSDNQSRF